MGTVKDFGSLNVYFSPLKNKLTSFPKVFM